MPSLSYGAIVALRAELPSIYFVGAGYWPDRESFESGNEPPTNFYLKDFGDAASIKKSIRQLGGHAPEGWVLFYFKVTANCVRCQITREQAEWILINRTSYY